MDVNADLIQLSVQYGEKILTALGRAGGFAFKKIGSELSWETRIAHTRYAESLVEKYAKLKTFFIRSAPCPLYDFYVPAAISDKKGNTVQRVGVADLEVISKRVIVTGTGGSGKTILMRHLLLDCLAGANRMPVFIELREIGPSSTSIKDAVYKVFDDHGFGLTRQFVDRVIQAGAVAFLLDGYDEVEPDSRKKVERQINELAKETGCLVFVSSRPDTHLDSWAEFSRVEIASLSLMHACDLVQKVPFDEEIKNRFVKELIGGLYDTHEYFLSNPLLLSIMLLTYTDSSSIPGRMTTFYQLAYEALYQRHDALKFGFKRHRLTSLDINQFSALFSAFSLVTYDERKFKFSQEYAIKATVRATKICGTSEDSASFIDDARQAVCLLIEDGLELSFAHRSFQEYFTAKFISEVGGDHQRKLIEKYSNKKSFEFAFEKVLDLLYELNPSVVERFWLIPALRKVFPGNSYKVRVGMGTWFSLISDSYEFLRLGKQIPLSVSSSSSFYLINTVAFVYRNCLAESQREEGSGDDMEPMDFSEKYSSQHEKIKFSEFSPESQMIKDLSRVIAPHSKRNLEKIRREFVAMLVRQKSRETQLDSIFG
ncbi:MAG: NACHT domain-containing protein [Xanthomonadales bacterium]|nr:NACHT domain-containing protein [Xanthomonadales bacterium]